MPEGASTDRANGVVADHGAVSGQPKGPSSEGADQAKASHLSNSLIHKQFGAGSNGGKAGKVGGSAGANSLGSGGVVGAKTNAYDTTFYTLTAAPKGITQTKVDALIAAKQKANPKEIGAKVSVGGAGVSAQSKIFLSWIVARLGSRKRWGTEADLVAEIGPAPKGGTRPKGQVTLRLDGAGNASIELISKAPPTVAKKFATVADGKAGLKTTYGFKSVIGDGASWSVSDLNKAAKSFGMLSAGEISALAGVVLRRTNTITGPDGKPLLGLFQHKAELTAAGGSTHSATLSLADGAFTQDTVSFVGGTKGSAPASIATILHEVGHAVETHALRKAAVAHHDADAATNRASSSFTTANNAYKADMAPANAAGPVAFASFNKLPQKDIRAGLGYARALNGVMGAIDKFGKNRSLSKVGQLRTAAKQAVTKRDTAKGALQTKSPTSGVFAALDPYSNSLDVLMKSALAAMAGFETWKKAQKISGVAKTKFDDTQGAERTNNAGDKERPSKRLLAFEKVAKGVKPVTAYAKTGTAEFYAESFSLWKSDPEYLAANCPKIKKWFDAGGHLKD